MQSTKSRHKNMSAFCIANIFYKSRPACREANEPLFEERSDAVKVSETPYPTNGSGKNLVEVDSVFQQY